MEQTKERIIKSAIKLFANKGFHETKVEDIAIESGIAKGTIYLYFKSKEELMSSCLDFIFSEAMKNYEVPDDLNFYESIKLIVENNFRFVNENIDFHKMLFKGMYTQSRVDKMNARRCQEEIWSKTLNSIEKIIVKGINEGKIKENISVRNLSIIFANIVISSVMTFANYKIRGLELDEGEYKEDVIKFLTGGIYEK